MDSIQRLRDRAKANGKLAVEQPADRQREDREPASTTSSSSRRRRARSTCRITSRRWSTADGRTRPIRRSTSRRRPATSRPAHLAAGVAFGAGVAVGHADLGQLQLGRPQYQRGVQPFGEHQQFQPQRRRTSTSGNTTPIIATACATITTRFARSTRGPTPRRDGKPARISAARTASACSIRTPSGCGRSARRPRPSRRRRSPPRRRRARRPATGPISATATGRNSGTRPRRWRATGRQPCDRRRAARQARSSRLTPGRATQAHADRGRQSYGGGSNVRHAGGERGRGGRR